MKVKELIKLLQKEDPEVEILVAYPHKLEEIIGVMKHPVNARLFINAEDTSEPEWEAQI